MVDKETGDVLLKLQGQDGRNMISCLSVLYGRYYGSGTFRIHQLFPGLRRFVYRVRAAGRG